MSAKLPPETIQQALELQAQGRTQQQISEALGVSRRTLGKYLRLYNERAMSRLEQWSMAEAGRQVAVLERMADEAIQAWERSKRDAVSVKIVRGEAAGKDGETIPVDRTETTVKGQIGNPAYLAQAIAALAEIRRIIGYESTDYRKMMADVFTTQELEKIASCKNYGQGERIIRRILKEKQDLMLKKYKYIQAFSE